MDEFLIKSEKEVLLRFHSPRHDVDGYLDSYSISLSARNLSASIEVENPPFGASPQRLFQQISNDWRGWRGEKEWQAIEGECGIKATSDALGHITLSVDLHPYPGAELWHVNMKVVVDAGSLDLLASEAKLFFGDES